MARTSGLLDLEFSGDRPGKTRLISRNQKFPLHFTVPLFMDEDQPGMAFVYVQNPSGAIFEGDRLDLRLVVRDGGKLHVTSTSATKLHRMTGGSAQQRVWLEAKRGSYIEYLPDQLIPQAQSSYEQKTMIDMDSGSMLIASEIIAPGRTARGEIFAFDRLRLDTRVMVDGRLLFIDNLLMEPALRPVSTRGALGSFLYAGNLMALCPGQSAKGILDAVSLMDMVGENFRIGFGALAGADGIVVRILARSSTVITALIDDVWSRIRMQLIGTTAPVRRK